MLEPDVSSRVPVFIFLFYYFWLPSRSAIQVWEASWERCALTACRYGFLGIFQHEPMLPKRVSIDSSTTWKTTGSRCMPRIQRETSSAEHAEMSAVSFVQRENIQKHLGCEKARRKWRDRKSQPDKVNRRGHRQWTSRMDLPLSVQQ